MASAVVCLLGLVVKQMGERVHPVDFTDSRGQGLLLDHPTDERMITVELLEHSLHHRYPIGGLLEMEKVRILLL